jgi:hypothetical protein
MKKVTDDGEEIRYFIEINSNPGEKIMDITGHNHYQDLLDFVEAECKKRKANKKADTEEASQGAKNFAEAYNSCKSFLNRK